MVCYLFIVIVVTNDNITVGCRNGSNIYDCKQGCIGRCLRASGHPGCSSEKL